MPKVHFGSRGGQYTMKAGKKVYLKNKFSSPHQVTDMEILDPETIFKRLNNEIKRLNITLNKGMISNKTCEAQKRMLIKEFRELEEEYFEYKNGNYPFSSLSVSPISPISPRRQISSGSASSQTPYRDPGVEEQRMKYYPRQDWRDYQGGGSRHTSSRPSTPMQSLVPSRTPSRLEFGRT